MEETICWDSSQTPAQNARRVLPPLVAAYFQAGRAVASAPVEPAGLHRFRLEGKRLRYTMELFKPVYSAGLDNYLKLLRGAQTRLGEFNDCMAARALLAQLPGSPVQKKRVTGYLEKHAAELYAEFQRYWREDVDQIERRWIRYVSRA
jgi:CHAD domain-containing protein